MRQGKVILADNQQNMLAGERNLLESMSERVFMVADLSLPVTKEINIMRRLKKAFPGITGANSQEKYRKGYNHDQQTGEENPEIFGKMWKTAGLQAGEVRKSNLKKKKRSMTWY